MGQLAGATAIQKSSLLQGEIETGSISLDHKITLANASNKSDVYPITYSNCVKVTESKTLDEVLKDERKYNNLKREDLIDLINAVITVLNNNDASLLIEINKLFEEVNKRVLNVGSGLNKDNSSQTVSLKLGKGPLKVNESDGTISLAVAEPLTITSDGVLSINTANLKSVLGI